MPRHPPTARSDTRCLRSGKGWGTLLRTTPLHGTAPRTEQPTMRPHVDWSTTVARRAERWRCAPSVFSGHHLAQRHGGLFSLPSLECSTQSVQGVRVGHQLKRTGTVPGSPARARSAHVSFCHPRLGFRRYRAESALAAARSQRRQPGSPLPATRSLPGHGDHLRCSTTTSCGTGRKRRAAGLRPPCWRWRPCRRRDAAHRCRGGICTGGRTSPRFLSSQERQRAACAQNGRSIAPRPAGRLAALERRPAGPDRCRRRCLVIASAVLRLGVSLAADDGQAVSEFELRSYPAAQPCTWRRRGIGGTVTTAL
jgi:hypothetical protein